jgi:hypothetical protein
MPHLPELCFKSANEEKGRPHQLSMASSHFHISYAGVIVASFSMKTPSSTAALSIVKPPERIWLDPPAKNKHRSTKDPH